MADLLVEIGVEELPARRVFAAAEALRDGLRRALAEALLLDPAASPPAPVLGTPRRLSAFVAGVLERQADRPERFWGPPVSAAFDAEGNPTKAAEGFARSAGVSLSALDRGEKVEGKPPYLFCDRVVPGRSAAEVVAEALPAVAASLPFQRTMRWPQSDMAFARPIRRLVVLLGTEVVPCRLAGVEAGRVTRGHRFLAPGEITLPSADLGGYRDALRAAKVIVDWEERTAAIRGQVARGRKDEDLLAEVTGLVEWPTTLRGSFEVRYLDLPPDLLVTAMAHHLRYFPVLDPGGAVMPAFLSVTDREESAAASIQAGNERVLRARLYDAAFFFRNDRKRPLEEFRPALAGVDFHRGLGTLLDKSERVRRIVASLCGTLGSPEKVRVRADRAAFLLKCDLLTEVVKEFPELQGGIGAHYAGMDGEGPSVAAALAGQYLPRGEWDPVLDDEVAALVSLAEKADSLAAFFSAGEGPTGSADPFGLRRHALGLLRILGKTEWPLSIEAALAPAIAEWPFDDLTRGLLLEFVWGRAEQVVRAEGFTGFAEAVGVLTGRPFGEYRGRLVALRALSREPAWKDLIALVERTGNMGVRSEAPPPADALPPEGRAVAEALERARAMAAEEKNPAVFARSYLGFLGTPVNQMFEKVLVEDASEPARREALKHLLFEVHGLFAGRLGDLRQLGSGARPQK
jgi:glycyl-tRNA synthetase beta chain